MGHKEGVKKQGEERIRPNEELGCEEKEERKLVEEKNYDRKENNMEIHKQNIYLQTKLQI